MVKCDEATCRQQTAMPCNTCLDEVLLDATGCGDEHVHQAVLHQVPDLLPCARRHQVRGVPQEDLGMPPCLWRPPRQLHTACRLLTAQILLLGVRLV